MSSSNLSDAFAGIVAVTGPLIAVLIVICSFAFSILLSVAIYVAMCLPIFKLAKNAGCTNAWLAWIPMGNMYLLMLIPHRTYKVIFDKFKTNNRKKAFWIYFAISMGYVLLSYAINFFVALLTIIPYIGVIISIINVAFSFLFVIVFLLITYPMFWRIMYDVLITYQLDSNTAMTVSIISCFFPPLLYIYLWIIMKKEPVYGFGNYYNTENWVNE